MQGAGRVRQHRGMMKKQNRPIGTGGRSSIDRLPATLREAVDRAIADGATIDEITAHIRAEGGACSRSAVGRHVKKVRDMVREAQAFDRIAETLTRTLGEGAEDHTGRLAIQCLRMLVLHAAADLRERAETEPVTVDEIARLALALGRIERADTLRIERERTAAKTTAKTTAEAAASADRPQGGKAKGFSSEAEAVAAIREAIEEKPPRPARPVTSAPVDPWAPPEDSPSSPSSPSSQSIPPNPSDSWPEIAPRVYRTSPTSILSLGPG